MRPMRRIVIAAALCAAMASPAAAQGAILIIDIERPNPRPAKPTAPINTLKELATALAGCWNPPPADASREPVDVIFQVSFKRSGELFGKPRVIQFAKPVTPEQRARYYEAVAEALDRCSQMPFTDAMGGAVAGRTFRVNFIDARNRKQARVPWLTTITS